MRFKAKQKKVLLFIVIVSIILFAFFNWQNNSIIISEMVFKNDTIPESFNGYKILQISDLHNKEFGSKQNKILAKIEKINPDIIVITGDLIDSNNTNIDIAMELINGAINIAPIYYVSGNHEACSGSYDDIKFNLENSGVVVLDNQKIEVFNDSDSIDIIGLADTAFIESDWLEYGGNAETKNLLNTLTEGSTNFKILLSHRPELFDIYSNSNLNLIFSGHAHGGQFRLPFIGGLIAPDQGFFPKLTEGIHTSNDTSMIISRGLGNSIIPVRILNRPELIVVTLSK
ncbi:metallophosphoesterase [Clostridium sp.]|uniref:metallophosphoesterase n=1 Tax=Clostridium sp. TaxID=1506 RepID=UPI001B78CD8F|nr:metallophosphoesterase [Clostridium sp.]MBP3917212.1 metallophosphoesterase [Clostridium sp.]